VSAARARAALAVADPKLGTLIERIGPRTIEGRRGERPEAHFEALARIVCGQQVSTAAARTIWGRIVESFGGRPPAATDVVGATEQLRACGLSGRKVSYIEGLGEAVISGEIDLEELPEMDDEEVAEAIVSLRGFGQWSAEMFLMFQLARPDVFSGGDLGLRHGIRIVHELDEIPSPAEAIATAERWRPHRTTASLYLWEAIAPS